MVSKIRKWFAIIFLFCAIFFFYSPFFITFFNQSAKIPVPADTLVGLYSPYRDYFSVDYPNGIPFKNFLITDPVRQTYIWRELAINSWKILHVPSWNPYEMAGKPFVGNHQSAAFYPLNLLLLIPPFSLSWSFFIILQSILAGIFTFLFLRNLKLSTNASTIGSAAFVFSGFSISWLEWGNVLHTALWLPVILLAIDNILSEKKRLKNIPFIDSTTFWLLLFTLFTSFSFFAGHLQTFFYLYIMALAYFIMRIFQTSKIKGIVIKFFIANIMVFLITFIQWFPTFRFILNSARSIDQDFRLVEGWFIPFQHLIQFLAPDFFGNPSTLNYWGTWNYGELTGYIGIVPIILACYAFFKKNPTVVFFGVAAAVGLIFALPTTLSNLPFIFNIPLFSSAQPTRLLFIIVFSLCVLSSFGASYVFKNEKINYKMFLPLFIPMIVIGIVWILVLTKSSLILNLAQNSLVAQRNLIFPTVILVISLFLIVILLLTKRRIIKQIIIVLILLVTFLDLLRFAQKFTPFVSREYLFPNTAAIDYLMHDSSTFRVAVLDRRIMPPNFFTHYKIATIEGYDPLYLKNYAEFVVALERNKPDISPPFGFNRIITPHNYQSELFNFLNTKYVLSYEELKDAHMVKVFEEGNTKIYENKNAFPRAFFVENVLNSQMVIASMFENDLRKTAVIGDHDDSFDNLGVGKVTINNYTENSITITSNNDRDGFLVISDAYYPTWEALIDGKKSKIYQTNHAFRGLFIPRGKHTIHMKDNLF